MAMHKTLVVFGDSFCYGTGLRGATAHIDPIKEPTVWGYNDVERWPYHYRNSFTGIVAAKNGMNLLNFAIPGCSNQTIHRLLLDFISVGHKRFGIDRDGMIVAVFWTGNARYEVFNRHTQVMLNRSPQWDIDGDWWQSDLHRLYNENIWDEKIDHDNEFRLQYSAQCVLLQKGVDFYQDYTLDTRNPELIDDELQTHIDKKRFPAFQQNSSAGITDEVMSLPLSICGHPLEDGQKLMADRLDKLLLGLGYV